MAWKMSYKRFLYAAVGVVAAAGYITFLLHHLGEMPPIQPTPAVIVTAVLSVLLAALITALGGLVWHILMRDIGANFTLRSALGIYTIAQFGKYLPGNIGQHLGRIALAREAGLPLDLVINSMVVELLWSTSLATVLALIGFGTVLGGQTLELGFSFGFYHFGLIAALLMFAPWLSAQILNQYFPKLSARISASGAIPTPTLRAALLISCLYVVAFLIYGLILKLQVFWLFGVKANLFDLTLLFALAWLAGFVVPGAPAGLGVREGVMIITMAEPLGLGTALGLGITLRLTTSLADILALLVGLKVLKTDNKIMQEVRKK